jgi:TolB-like protein
MYRLHTLGQLDLRDADGGAVTAILVQPKRLALLAYMAITATGTFQRRDLLLPMFWPELSEARARNALRQAIHQLRRALGAGVVVSRGADMLGIDGARLWCDACAFEAALARGALDEAVALYGGDLLPGLGIDGAEEFERWLEDARASLGRRAERATRTLAERRAHAEAVTTPTPATNGATRDRERVTVVPFRNLTGDATFDYVGRLVCDAVAQGILESRTVDVVTIEQADEASVVATVGFVVTGSYALCGDAWRFQARVGDAAGRVLDSIGDVTAPRLQPWEATEELRRRVCGKLAGRHDPRFASWADAVTQAPDLDAHHELAVGVEQHLRGDYRAAIPHLLRAARARDGFTLAALWAIQASCNLREWEQAEAILAELTDRSRRGHLSAFEQLGCDYFAACLDGQRGAALRFARAAAELVPDSEVLSQLGREAIFCNQPRAAAAALERLDPGRGWIPSWTPHWRRLTEALHMLGDHVRELDAALRGRANHPEEVSAVLYEARAHAALGDMAAVDRCIDAACALPPDPFTDAGGAMLEVARELRAHGRPDEGRALATRAVAWYRERDGDGAHASLPLACALYECGRWHDARAALTAPLPTGHDDVEVTGLAGGIAAHLGDEPAARDALRMLRAKTGRFRYGAQFMWMARILAVLGEAEAAMTALHGAFARGYKYGIELHTDADFASLGERVGFRELLRPKG